MLSKLVLIDLIRDRTRCFCSGVSFLRWQVRPRLLLIDIPSDYSTSSASPCDRRFRAVKTSFVASFDNRSKTSPFAMSLLLWCLAFAWALKDSCLLLVCTTVYLSI